AMHANQHVLERGEAPVQPDVLKRSAHTHARDLVGLATGNVNAVEPDGAAVGEQLAGHQVEHGCLTGAVGADQSGDGTGLDRKGHTVDGPDPAEVAVDVEQLEQGQRFVHVAGGGGAVSG